MSTILSILIPSTPDRFQVLTRLLQVLNPQLTNQTELIILVDSKQENIAQKRNRLLLAAKGAFIAFIDDDDLVSELYVKTILDSIITNPEADCVEMRGVCYWINEKKQYDFHHSINFAQYETINGVRVGYPNHLNPIKRTHALQIGFDITRPRGEDTDYANRLKEANLLKIQTPISIPLYSYLYQQIKG